MELNSNHRPLAVVTRASSGIGYELAKQFGQNGFDLLITAEDESIEQAAREMGHLGTSVRTVQADLAQYEGVAKLFGTIQRLGRPVEATE